MEGVFGKKNYKYKLSLEQEMPEFLYKERNFNLEVKLTDANNQPIRNGTFFCKFSKLHSCMLRCFDDHRIMDPRESSWRNTDKRKK